MTFADRLPRMYHATRQIDVIEDVRAPRDSVLGQEVKAASVDVDYFDVLGAPILAGRSFNAADLESGHRVVIVNQSFVDRVLQGRNAIGRRVRFTNREWWDPWSPEPGPWYEIVGVAKDLGMKELGQASVPDGAGLYDPLARGQIPVYMAVRVRSDPASFGPRLREVAHAVDPTLRLYDYRRMDELHHGAQTALANLLRITLLTSSVALLLSLAGIYSVTSFAVSRRTREIGIRVALGADARRIIVAIFARPLAQVAVGIVAGAGLVGAMTRGIMGDRSMSTAPSAEEIGLVLASAVLVAGACLLACSVPARRALAVQPTEALNADG
ncbi:MAG: ABC transporter permease [Longimicrobiales bacterium]